MIIYSIYRKLIPIISNNTLSEQILAIEEEVLAWHFGEEAARNLDIDLSDKKYQVLKAKCLKSHIQSYKKVTNDKEEYI